MLSFAIAGRFLRKSPAQTALIILGISAGIAVQVFVGSLITSLQASLVDQTIGSSPHLSLVAPDEGDAFTLTDPVDATVRRDPRVTAVAAVDNLSVIYSDGGQDALLALKGGDLRRLDGIYRLIGRTTAGRPSLGPSEIMLGEAFAERYGFGPGDRISLIQPDGKRSSLRVTALFDLGSAQANERTAFVSQDFTHRALGYDSRQMSALEMQVTEPFRSSALASDWRRRSAFAEVRVRDWQQDNRDLLSALRSQSSSSYLIQVFVLVAVALGIASTLAISAVQKTRQIGILKAMGMTDRRAAFIFLWQGAMLGVAGTGGGVILGLGLIASFALASSRAATPLFPIEPQPGFIIASALVGVSVALVSSVIPSRRTSRLSPIEVIQGG